MLMMELQPAWSGCLLLVARRTLTPSHLNPFLPPACVFYLPGAAAQAQQVKDTAAHKAGETRDWAADKAQGAKDSAGSYAQAAQVRPLLPSRCASAVRGSFALGGAACNR